ncbi:hypothetical protein, partial [Mycoplasmopsis bovis]|uniref:hypothetical protein n=1 Tax=Mycoplasmopsis bovis TaxID=28903 RepID=UPI003D2CB6DF
AEGEGSGLEHDLRVVAVDKLASDLKWGDTVSARFEGEWARERTYGDDVAGVESDGAEREDSSHGGVTATSIKMVSDLSAQA